MVLVGVLTLQGFSQEHIMSVERVKKELRFRHLVWSSDDQSVAVRQGNVLATAFHPELIEDDRFHAFFLDLVFSSRF